jgi:competence ComEA-like helix-hairpin-helix protein
LSRPLDPASFVERLFLCGLAISFLLALGLLQVRRQHPSFSLEVFSEKPPRPVPTPTLSLNSATEEELERLPGIGPKLAGRIVAYRDRQGRFTSLEELFEVKGMGQKLYARILPYLRLQ